MIQIKNNYLKKFATWLLPHTCILCGQLSKRTQDLCLPCLNDLPRVIHACPSCAKPFQEAKHNHTCGYCLTQTPPFDRTFALFIYEAPITKLIMDLKFGQTLAHARVLGELLLEQIETYWYRDNPLPEAIIPIPLHPKRLQERGYNQALEMARPIAKKLKRPLILQQCQRIIYTTPQATLPAEQRRQNIKKAFQITDKLPYQHIAVLDDVITTGQTVAEFCHTLNRAGVSKIDVWCCARPYF